jgi:hypothetical protein
MDVEYTLRDFVDPRKLKATVLDRTNDDALGLKGGDRIADSGLFAALKQILREAGTDG